MQRSAGRHGGRPKVVDDDMADYARSLWANGVPVPEITRKLVITSGKNKGQRPSGATVYRILADTDEAGGTWSRYAPGDHGRSPAGWVPRELATVEYESPPVPNP